MRHISLKILFITCLVGFGLISCGGGSGGSGESGIAIGTTEASTCGELAKTDDNWLEISNAVDLKAIGEDTESMAKNYCLIENINLADKSSGFPLGFKDVSSDSFPFTGDFDGGGKTISNLIVNKPSKELIGLFAKLGTGTGADDTSSIKNLNLVNFKMTGLGYVGGLAGDAGGKVTISHITVDNVTVKVEKGTNDKGHEVGGTKVGGLLGTMKEGVTVTHSAVIGGAVTSTANYAGGLVGSSYSKSKILNSSSTSVVKGNGYVGGLSGSIGADVGVSNSYAAGSVTGEGNYIGGLVGGAYEANISNSYATGAVTGANEVGGLAGKFGGRGRISNSYATGIVTATGDKGGLVGKLDNCSSTNVCEVTNSYFDKSGTNSGISDIGSGRNSATITGLVGVAGAGDIVEASDGSYNLKSTPATKIFVDWNKDAEVWQFATGAWPTLLHSK